MTSKTSSGVLSGVGVHVASGVVIVSMPDAVLEFMYTTVVVGVGVGVFVASGVFVGVAVDVASGVLVGQSSGVALTRLRRGRRDGPEGDEQRCDQPCQS
jgi:hypothetical protein